MDNQSDKPVRDGGMEVITAPIGKEPIAHYWHHGLLIDAFNSIEGVQVYRVNAGPRLSTNPMKVPDVYHIAATDAAVAVLDQLWQSISQWVDHDTRRESGELSKKIDWKPAMSVFNREYRNIARLDFSYKDYLWAVVVKELSLKLGLPLREQGSYYEGNEPLPAQALDEFPDRVVLYYPDNRQAMLVKKGPDLWLELMNHPVLADALREKFGRALAVQLNMPITCTQVEAILADLDSRDVSVVDNG